MGSPRSEKGRCSDEEQAAVSLTRGFFLGETPITQAQWFEIMRTKPSHFKGAMRPVEQVSWNDAMAFVRKLNKLKCQPPGWSFALPSEAQWEYACRAGTASPWYFGDSLTPKHANYGDVGIYRTSDVGSFPENKWGLRDMHGNVWEWCHDRYGKLEGGINPMGAKSGRLRVARGGSWRFGPELCRSASRSDGTPGCRYVLIGFRLALVNIS